MSRCTTGIHQNNQRARSGHHLGRSPGHYSGHHPGRAPGYSPGTGPRPTGYSSAGSFNRARFLLAALCLLFMFPGIHNPAAAESSDWSESGTGHIAMSEPAAETGSELLAMSTPAAESVSEYASRDKPAPNYPFLSDLMRKAWENWLDNTGATLIGYEEPTIQTYGYRMPLKYRIGTEEVTVCWYIDAHDRIYDVGEDITGFAFRGPEAIERIVSRMLWARSVTDPVVLKNLWHLSSESVNISYDNTVGTENVHLDKYLSDLRQGTRRVEALDLTTSQQKYFLTLVMNGKELNFEIVPNLFLFLNGEPAVVTGFMEAVLAGRFEVTEIADLHEFHQFQEHEGRFSVMIPDRERRLVNIKWEQTTRGWVRSEQSRDPEAGQNPALSLREELFDFWLTRNFPPANRTSRLDPPDTGQLRVMLDGASAAPEVSGHVSVPDVLGWLGRGMMTHVEVELRDSESGRQDLTTYILYFDPVLAYQHMARIHDRFELGAGGTGDWQWTDSRIHILPAVRLDNLEDAYGHADFPDEDYERYFEIIID